MDKSEIIALAELAGIEFRLGSTDVTPEKLDRFLMFALNAIENRGGAVRRFGIWMRPEGVPAKRGLNLTIIGDDSPSGCYKGFVLILRTKATQYRFRFRRGIKPMFLWRKGV
jgi:hypothetical protein